MMINLKKAAMFGLDARIALAIFGALSVISGAALYSAINQSKIVAIVAQMNEVGKAVEQYILDTGQDLAIDATYNQHSTVANLVENTTPVVSNWKGPYLQYKLDGAWKDRFIHDKYNLLTITNTTKDGWGDTVSEPACVSNCYYYTRLDNVPFDFSRSVDQYVDGSDSPTTGKVRVFNGATYSSLFFSIGPTLR